MSRDVVATKATVANEAIIILIATMIDALAGFSVGVKKIPMYG